MNDVAVNPAPDRNAAGRTRFREGEAGVKKSWAGGNAAFIADSLHALPGEHPSSFPALAKGGPGAVAPAQAVTEFSKGLLTRLGAFLS
ncbi:MAG: hypothetical protein ACHRXM_29040, partial [Isosphaerales bacterium]